MGEHFLPINYMYEDVQWYGFRQSRILNREPEVVKHAEIVV